MFSTTCFTSEKMAFMIQVLPMTLIIVIIVIAGIRIGSKRVLTSAAPKKSEGQNALSAATAVVKKNKSYIGIISFLTTLYAGFLSFKKNKGFSLSGALASVFSPQLYIVMMLSTAKKLSLNSFLGKGEWKKCLSIGLPWWYWLFLAIILIVMLFYLTLSNIL